MLCNFPILPPEESDTARYIWSKMDYSDTFKGFVNKGRYVNWTHYCYRNGTFWKLSITNLVPDQISPKMLRAI